MAWAYPGQDKTRNWKEMSIDRIEPIPAPGKLLQAPIQRAQNPQGRGDRAIGDCTDLGWPMESQGFTTSVG
ncbi:MAG: hypothetical protein HC860_06465 [Alkalinema sp. RU_4_3]|nr:hypothetical protein [Alkalinema sp. RU_4_3]